MIIIRLALFCQAQTLGTVGQVVVLVVLVLDSVLVLDGTVVMVVGKHVVGFGSSCHCVDGWDLRFRVFRYDRFGRW